MKKLFLLMAFGSLLTCSVVAQTTEINWHLAKDGDIILHPHPKSPINLSFLPTVTFNDETNVLTFEGNSDLGAVPYEVEDACENIVSSGVRYIYLNGTTTVSLGTLTAGTYTLYIIVGDNTYAGEFEVSAE